MRKHFLILMLLTLLPLAGWAEEQFSAQKTIVAVSKIEYKQATDPTIRVSHEGILLVKDDGAGDPEDYVVDGFVAEQSASAPTIALGDLQVGQTYYVRVSGVGVYTGKAYGAFTVEKATLTVTINGDFEQPYKNGAVYNLPANHSNVTVSWVGHPGITVNDYLKFESNYGYTPKYDANKAAGTYPITFTGVSAKDDNNFKVEYAAKNLVINKQTILDAAPWYTTRTAASYNPAVDKQFTYTAAAQKPTYTVEWDHDGNGANAKIPLVEGTDFTVKYFVSGNEVAADKVVNADIYDIKIVGKGNYEGTVDFTGSADHQFIIKKAPLTIMTLPQTKYYDGDPFVLATAKYNIAGRVGGDASLQVNGLVATATSLSPNKGDYSINVNYAAATIGTGATPLALSRNYDITTVAINWTINKRPVTLTIPNSNMTKGAVVFPDITGALEAATVEKGFNDVPEVIGEAGAINATDQAAIAACYERAWANGAGEALKDVTPTNIETKTYANAIKGNVKAGLTPEQVDLLANYEVSVVKGSLIVGGDAFTVIPVVESNIEYGDTYTIGYYAYKTGDATKVATIDASQLVFVINGTEYPYAAQIAGLPTARGNYNVTIKAGTAVGTGDYNDGAATLSASAFTIVKKKLNVKVKDQKVAILDVAADFLAGLAANNNSIEVTGVKEGETLSFVYSFSDDIEVGTGADEGKIITVPGIYGNAILVALKAGDAANENYEIPDTYTKGTLTIDWAHSIDLAAADALETIATAAGNGSDYIVTISGRQLTAETWNVLVLPFDVNPLDFCNAVGTYAVFNTLSKVEKDATDPLKDKIYFKLAMNTIPANQPFLVKPLAAVDFDEIDEGDPDDPTDDFKANAFCGVKIKNADPRQEIPGANFIGTYAESAPTTDDFWALQGGVFKHFSSAKTIKFTRAFIELTSGAAAAEFFIEDIDNNGVTAIKSLSADQINGLAVMGQGWYTLNGIKLQSAPVVKGVYIHNGKKVVIK